MKVGNTIHCHHLCLTTAFLLVSVYSYEHISWGSSWLHTNSIQIQSNIHSVRRPHCASHIKIFHTKRPPINILILYIIKILIHNKFVVSSTDIVCSRSSSIPRTLHWPITDISTIFPVRPDETIFYTLIETLPKKRWERHKETVKWAICSLCLSHFPLPLHVESQAARFPISGHILLI